MTNGPIVVVPTTTPSITVVGGTTPTNTQNSIVVINGEKGDPGIQGAQGVQGVQGVQGAQGATGNQGLLGPQGITGLQGLTGLQGVTGAQGVEALWKFRGAWVNGIDYAAGDVVEFNGSSYYTATGVYSSYSPGYPGVDWVLVSSKGEAGAAGNDGAQGPSGVIAVTSPITNSGTPTAANIGVSVGSTSSAGVLQLTDSVSSTSTTTAATPASVKTANDNALLRGLDWRSGAYYKTLQGNGAFACLANTTYYTPLIVPSNLSVDRIMILTTAAFSGTAVARLGIYSNSNSAPNQLILDAGTVSCTAANTVYQITINQALSAGVYWLAMNTQTAAASNSFQGVPATGNPGILGLPQNANAYYYNSGFSQSGVTGAFANAGTLAYANAIVTPLVRKV